jgi:hypothetical protein
VLCDELQRWHRPPIGRGVQDPVIYESLRVRPSELYLRAVLDLENPDALQYGCSSAAVGIRKTNYRQMEPGRFLATLLDLAISRTTNPIWYSLFEDSLSFRQAKSNV